MLTSYEVTNGDEPIVSFISGLRGFCEGPRYETITADFVIVEHEGTRVFGYGARLECVTQRPSFSSLTFHLPAAPERLCEMLMRACLDSASPHGSFTVRTPCAPDAVIDMSDTQVKDVSYRGGGGPATFTLATNSLRLREQLPWPVRA